MTSALCLAVGMCSVSTIAAWFCRQDSYCNLDLTDPVCGYDTVAAVDALSFTVQDNVQVKAVAYKILYDCDGGQCSYTS